MNHARQVWQLQLLELSDWATFGASVGLRTAIYLVLGAGPAAHQGQVLGQVHSTSTTAANTLNATNATKPRSKRWRWRTMLQRCNDAPKPNSAFIARPRQLGCPASLELVQI